MHPRHSMRALRSTLVVSLSLAVAAPMPALADARAHAHADVAIAISFAEAVTSRSRHLQFDDLVSFEPGRVRVYSKSRERIQAIVQGWLDAGGTATFNVTGYASAPGRATAASLALAQRRAAKIKGYLVRYGVPAELIVATGAASREAGDPRSGHTVDLSIDFPERSFAAR